MSCGAWSTSPTERSAAREAASALSAERSDGRAVGVHLHSSSLERLLEVASVLGVGRDAVFAFDDRAGPADEQAVQEREEAPVGIAHVARDAEVVAPGVAREIHRAERRVP